MRVFTEDEWGKAEMSNGTAEDDPVLSTPGLQGEEQCLDDGCPQKRLPEGDASRMGPTWGYGAKLVQDKYVPSALNAPASVLTMLMRKDTWTG